MVLGNIEVILVVVICSYLNGDYRYARMFGVHITCLTGSESCSVLPFGTRYANGAGVADCGEHHICIITIMYLVNMEYRACYYLE